MSNLAQLHLVATEGDALVYQDFEADAPIAPGTYDVVVQMTGYASGAWSVSLAGTAACLYVNEDGHIVSNIFADGTYNMTAVVLNASNNNIHVLGRLTPGGHLSILSVTPAAA